MTITIRQAEEKDAHHIASIHIASWQVIYAGIIPDDILARHSVGEKAEKWRQFIHDGMKVLLIESENKPVGFASIGPSRDADTDQIQCAEITTFYLHPTYWRRGLGRKLCDETLAELIRMGYSEVILWALKENDRASAFYEAMGFTKTGKTKVERFGDNVTLNEFRYWKKLK